MGTEGPDNPEGDGTNLPTAVGPRELPRETRRGAPLIEEDGEGEALGEGEHRGNLGLTQGLGEPNRKIRLDAKGGMRLAFPPYSPTAFQGTYSPGGRLTPTSPRMNHCR